MGKQRIWGNGMADIDTHEKSPRNQQPWWLVSLFVATCLVSTATVAILLPHPYGVAVLVVALVVFVGLIVFNPLYRYKLAYNAIITGWLYARSIPSIEVWNPEFKDKPLFKLSNEVSWSFDLACTVIAVILLRLDYLIREPNQRQSLIKLFGIQLFSNNNSPKAESGSQQVNFGKVSGNGNQINISLQQTVSDFNPEIDVAASYLKESKPDIAIEKLKELKRRHWHALSDREKYRIAANIGHAFNQKGECSAAVDGYVEAIQYLAPGEERLSLEATVYFLQGKNEDAIRIAKCCIKDFPSNLMARAVFIRVSADSISTDELESEIPIHLRSSFEILDALFLHAAKRMEFSKAESYARTLMCLDSSSRHPKMRLGAILASKSINGKMGRTECAAEDVQRQANEAVSLLTDFIAHEGSNRFSIGYSKYHRALAYESLDRNDEAEADLRSANEILPDDQDIRFQLGVFLVSHGKHEQAIKHLAAIDSAGPLCQSKLLLGRLLLSRNGQGDLEKTCEILLAALNFDSRRESCFTFEALLTLVEAFGKQSLLAKAEEVISEYGSELPLAYVSLLKASCYASAKELSNANVHALQAKSLVTECTAATVLYKLADLLARLDKQQEAVDVYRLIPNLAAFSDGVELALSSAWKAEEYKYIISLCESVRSKGVFTIPICEVEIATLERVNELKRAVELIELYLSRIQDDEFRRSLRLRKSIIGKRLGIPSLVTYDLNLLPVATTSNLSEACNAALILAEGPDRQASINYAYEVVRNNFDEAQSHMCLLAIAGPSSEAQFPSIEVIEPGCAVSYLESDESLPKWIIIEDGPNPAPSRNEYLPTSDVARELYGKRVGEQFFIRRGIQDRIGVIQSILGKTEFRMRDSLQNWEERFPDVPFIQAFKFKKLKNGDLDVEDFLATLSRMNEPREEIESLYRREPLSVSMFSQLIKQPLLDSIGYLANHAELPIRCCAGTEEEYASAIAALESEKKVVIDPSALATLFFLGVWETSKRIILGEGYIVSTGALDCFRDQLRDPKAKIHASMFATSVRNRLVFQERTDADIQLAKDSLSAFIDWVKGNTTEVGGLGLAELSKDHRDRLGVMFDDATVESLGTAIAHDAVLWTDDFAIASQGFLEGITPPSRIWTAVAVDKLFERNLMTAEQRSEALLSLIIFDYRFTRLDQSVFELAITRGRWNVEKGPLVSIFSWISNSGVNAEGAMQTAIQIIRMVWAQAFLAHQRRDVAAATIKSLGQRADAVILLRELDQALPKIFGLDVTAINECGKLIKNEVAYQLKGKTLVLPGDPDWPSR
jgi:tetratricopeptide (TPR) repeat protein